MSEKEIEKVTEIITILKPNLKETRELLKDLMRRSQFSKDQVKLVIATSIVISNIFDSSSLDEFLSELL